MKTETVKEYANDYLTIVWKAEKCIHSMHCWKELPEVFDTQKRPWIDPHGASNEKIMAQIKRCPSGALSYYLNAEKGKEKTEEEKTVSVLVQPTIDGPLLITGLFELEKQDGTKEKINEPTAFCRCGASKNMPYCDGSHLSNHFKG